MRGRGRDVLGAAGRLGEDVVKARVALVVGAAAAVVAGGLALLVLVVLALAGSGPGLGWSVAVVAGTALVAALAARAAVNRVTLGAVAAFVARRIARRRAP